MNVHERAEMLAAVDLDFRLSDAERRELHEHLGACLDCRTVASRVRADAGSLQEIATVDPAPRLRAAFAAAVARPDRLGSVVLADLRPWLRLAAVAALLAALVTGLLVVGSVGSKHDLPGMGVDASVPPSPPPSGPLRVTALAGQTERVCSSAIGLRVANGAAYVVCLGELERPALGGEPAVRQVADVGDVAPFGPDVWAVGTHALRQLDAMSLAIRKETTQIGGDAIAIDHGAVWVLQIMAQKLIRLDPDTLRVVATIGVGPNPATVFVAFGRVWVSNRDDGTVAEIDPATNRVASTFHVGAGPAGFAATDHGLWVANNADGTASRIDPASGQVLTIPIAPAAHTSDLPSIVASGSTVWAADSHQQQIAEIDDTTASIRRWIAPPTPLPADIAAIGETGRSVLVLDTSSLLQELVLP